MGTLFLEKHFSPLDILVKNFFNAEQEEFQQPNNRIINHPVDIYEDKTGLYFDIACTGLTKKQIELKVEDDILRVIYTKKDDKEEKDLEFDLADFGTINLQTVFSSLRSTQEYNLDKIISTLSIGPRKVLDMPIQPIQEGSPADITLFSPDAVWNFTKDNLFSKTTNTPLLNEELTGEVHGVINNGKLALKELINGEA